MKTSQLDWKVTAGLVCALLLTGLFAAAWFLTPGYEKPVMESGEVSLSVQEDGLLLVWPEQPAGISCRVSVKTGDSGRFRGVKNVSDRSAVIPDVTLQEPLQIRIQAVTVGKNVLRMDRHIVSDNSIAVTVAPHTLLRPALEGEPHEDGLLVLTWDGGSGVSYEVCTVDNDICTPLNTVQGGTASIRFAADGDRELPDYDEKVSVGVRAVYHENGYLLYGPLSALVTVERNDLLGSNLVLDCIETGERMYTLCWKETKGDHYLVQEWDPKANTWDTLQQIHSGETLSYETGRLSSGSSHRYRVTAQDGTVESASDEISFRTAYSPLYATIWPILDQPLYSDAQKTTKLATIPGGTTLCVLEEANGCFSVRYQEQYGYVDSRFCMIDLPEYIGDLCTYNITNSYDSIFKIHTYSIPNVTSQVIKGFENVLTANGSYLVPFLYPSAQKLIKAAEAAEKDGYRLKIYEAYRPNEATRFLFDTTQAILNDPIPELNQNVPSTAAPTAVPTAARMARSGILPDLEPAAEENPDPVIDTEPEPILPPTGDTESQPVEESPTDTPADPTPEPEPTVPAEPEPDKITYGKIMTDGRFKISAFLAASVSNHNRGVALDLTLEKLSDGQELEMQSAIHDLSWYAASYRNNENAKLLERYMKDTGGMNGLTSEWWHFQDDEIRAALNLTGYLSKGVSPEGWVKDDTGWRYRKADGSFQHGGSITVDGNHYQLDQDGYVKE